MIYKLVTDDIRTGPLALEHPPPPGVTTTIPGLGVRLPSSSGILVPDVPPGTYRLQTGGPVGGVIPFVIVDVIQGVGRATGVVAVSLEEVGGFFIEGFEIGLRFENATGEVIAATLWSDFVVSQGDTSLEDFYDSILEQVVPAGELVVLATANVGMGPPPEVPDLGGDLRCRLEVVVPENGRVNVEVSFVNHENCLSVISGG